jgi:hypothetical protein
MCLHAHSSSFVLYYRHVYGKGRSSETMIPEPVLAVRKALVTF